MLCCVVWMEVLGVSGGVGWGFILVVSVLCSRGRESGARKGWGGQVSSERRGCLVDALESCLIIW